MIRRDELDRMQQGLDALVVGAQTVAPTELRAIEGFAGGSSVPDRDAASATIRWRVGLSSAAPTTLRVAVSTRVDEVLAEMMKQKPALRQRAPWRLASVVDDAHATSLQPLPPDASLASLGVSRGSSVGLVLVPDERPENQPSAALAKRDTQARAAAARASSRELFAADPDSGEDVPHRSHGITLLYRIERARAAPRSMHAGPMATVIDVLEEIAEREPSVAIRLAAGERLRLARGEDREVLDYQATMQTLFRPGGTYPVCVL